ncbi:MAG: hypothetical protein U9R23_07475 [Candidatus Cloacimonadota bacterium]|nr:hypothetical protein [Candidatus Cloacimonadota bacterium]
MKKAPYNYCDYRCEKCPVKDRCTVYKKEIEDRYEDKDWFEILKENLEEAREMIGKFIKENKIEILPLNEEDPFEKIHIEVQKKHIIKLSNDYLIKAEDFLQDYRARYLSLHGLEEPFSDLDWYKTIIPVKIHRTLDSLQKFVVTKDEFFLEDAYYTSLVVYKSLWKSLSGIRKIRNTINVSKLADEIENLLIEIIVEFKKEFPFEFIIGLLEANT